jgi:hypothetical protein
VIAFNAGRESKINRLIFFRIKFEFLVTRVRSHGYVQVSFNIVKKDMEALGYKSEAKSALFNAQQRSDNIEATSVDNY